MEKCIKHLAVRQVLVSKQKIVEHSTQAELEAISEKQVLPCIGRMMNWKTLSSVTEKH